MALPPPDHSPLPTTSENADDVRLDRSAIERLRELQEPGEPDLVAEVLDLFAADGAARVDQLESALAGGRPEDAVRLGHSLKGSAASLGALRLARLCAAIERDPAELTPEMMRAIREEFDLAVAALRRASTP